MLLAHKYGHCDDHRCLQRGETSQSLPVNSHHVQRSHGSQSHLVRKRHGGARLGPSGAHSLERLLNLHSEFICHMNVVGLELGERVILPCLVVGRAGCECNRPGRAVVVAGMDSSDVFETACDDVPVTRVSGAAKGGQTADGLTCESPGDRHERLEGGYRSRDEAIVQFAPI